jgi:hypothetical protein
MATEELTAEPVDDGEWVVFWSLAILILYVTGIVALAGLGVVLL